MKSISSKSFKNGSDSYECIQYLKKIISDVCACDGCHEQVSIETRI